LYEADLQADGYVANLTRAFSLRPDALVAWRQLALTIRKTMDPRWYELVTIAVAAALRCQYSTLVHGAALRSQFYSAEQVEAIVRDYRHAGLNPPDVAMMALAEKISLRAHEVTPEDIDGLRAYGFTDPDILDIVLAAAARNFFSRALEALGAEPDAEYLADTGLLRALAEKA
jgi:uncharacterized peroxidase-related enzyme